MQLPCCNLPRKGNILAKFVCVSSFLTNTQRYFFARTHRQILQEILNHTDILFITPCFQCESKQLLPIPRLVCHKALQISRYFESPYVSFTANLQYSFEVHELQYSPANILLTVFAISWSQIFMRYQLIVISHEYVKQTTINSKSHTSSKNSGWLKNSNNSFCSAKFLTRALFVWSCICSWIVSVNHFYCADSCMYAYRSKLPSSLIAILVPLELSWHQE